ncbi:hypothetical protein CIRG_05401 [Coccidioides immitis RMSCC 2394]|uniref:Predicted protein n=2 Tax=Coccidioides TaxID=5500 RepID=E9D7I6_COCPS|nr:predicted protein [Coccidioides posadasii str. Silveira]KMP05720.1 hypothetical protein CIRG_05401 [Coccidioides immitis RMSCC 2394]
MGKRVPEVAGSVVAVRLTFCRREPRKYSRCRKACFCTILRHGRRCHWGWATSQPLTGRRETARQARQHGGTANLDGVKASGLAGQGSGLTAQHWFLETS